MNFCRPEHLDDALSLLAKDQWLILSGGTDFYPALGDRQPSGNIMDVSALRALRHISEDATHWKIGALATWSDVLGADLPAAFDGLKLAAREVGSVQIQNRATVVGNICNASPAADGMPPLLTLDAVVELASTQGKRQVALNEFVTGNRQTVMQPDELVSGLAVPKSSARGQSTFIKLGARKYLVISISMVAARLVIDNDRIGEAAISVGSCSLVAKRLCDLEKALIGQRADGALVNFIEEKYFAPLSPIDDVRASGAYRLEVSVELVRRAISTLLAGG